MLSILVVVLPLATFVVGAYVGVHWQRRAEERAIEKFRRHALELYERRVPPVLQRAAPTTSVVHFPAAPNHHQYVNRTIDP